MTSAASLPSSVVRGTVESLNDTDASGEPSDVHVAVRPQYPVDGSDVIVVSFHVLGNDADRGLAERARALEPGAEIDVGFVTIQGDGATIRMGRSLSDS